MTEKIKNLMNKFFNNRFFLKNGMFSKTAAILIATWVIVLFKYLFATCIISLVIPAVNIKIYWPIVFDWADAGALTGAASTLYFAVHNFYKKDQSVKNNGGDLNDSQEG